MIQAMNNPLRRRPLLLLLLLMACAPSHHRVRLASATDLSGTADSVDRESASVVVKVRSRACRVPGQSSQCSSVCGVWPHLGQLGRGVNCVVHQMFVCRKTAAADGDGAILMLLRRR